MKKPKAGKFAKILGYDYYFFPRKPAATFWAFKQHVSCRILVDFWTREKTFHPTKKIRTVRIVRLCWFGSVGKPSGSMENEINYKFTGIREVNVLSKGARRPTPPSATRRMEGRRSRGQRCRWRTHERDPRRFEVFRNDHSSSTAAPLVSAAALMIGRVLNRIFPRTVCTLGPASASARKPNNGSPSRTSVGCGRSK